MNAVRSKTSAYMACVPHAPMLKLQDRKHHPAFWSAYEDRIKAFERFDPELVIVFGGDHVSTVHLRLMPTVIVGQIAEAIEDWGGKAGKLDVPGDLAIDLADRLAAEEFDIATSYDMKVDHGFSAVMENFYRGEIGARPTIPIFVNSHFRPRPSLKRCRMLGDAVGRWAAGLGKRVAFIGSGGLSHDVSEIFPQYDAAPTDEHRALMVQGHERLGIDLQRSMAEVRKIMEGHAAMLLAGSASPVGANPDWDREFLDMLENDLTVFDRWTDEDVLERGGSGGGEVRLWIAAAAAGQAAGAPPIKIDFFTRRSTLGFGLGIAHAGGDVGADAQ
jgi:2,3-dihydroxyphenylpropionate 1,2-dioxygenase